MAPQAIMSEDKNSERRFLGRREVEFYAVLDRAQVTI
jgi:hypothetical protein